ncbi:MAG: hypothetical protein CBE24_05490 [bacterium TMED264]|nr:MAG: hypothetical protein CBE24_05490 [bacterium TMED264]
MIKIYYPELKKKFKAIVTYQNQNGDFENKIIQKSFSDLPEGNLLVKVEYSSLNYKDALSSSGAKGVTRFYPHTPGIDAAGIVIRSDNNHFETNDRVIVTGFDLGMNTSGGFAEYIQVPSSWALKCPDSLSTKDSMILGTAGLTAGLCIEEIEKHIAINNLKVIVSGSTGGVGSIAVKLLSLMGAKVTAITGKKTSDQYLNNLGSSKIIQREEFVNSTRLPLSKGVYDAAVDTVGGNILSTILACMKYNGIITACGNVAGANFATSVFPFILRSNHLIGIDSATCPITIRERIWKKFSTSWNLKNLDQIYKVVDLSSLGKEIKKILRGKQVGRILVRL